MPPKNSKKNIHPENRDDLATSEPTSENHVGNPLKSRNPLSDVHSKKNNGDFSLPTENNVGKPIPVSAHRLQWKFHITSHRPQRPPFRSIHMTNWEQRIWQHMRATFVSGPRTLQLFMKTGRYKTITRLLKEAQKRAHTALVSFCEWQRITVKPVHSAHPEDLHSAHLVIEDKSTARHLKPLADRPDSSEIGLVFDKSHSGKPELTGEYSAEGVKGLDYLALRFPERYRLDRKEDARRWEHHSQAIELIKDETDSKLALLAEGQTEIMKKLVVK